MSCGLPAVKLFLVALLEQVSDQAKAEALLPTIQDLTDRDRASDWEKLFGSQFEEFATIIISALDSSVSAHLNDTSGAFWPVFLHTIRFYFRPGKYRSSDRVESPLTPFRIVYSTERGALQKFAKWPVLSPIPRSPDRDLRVDHRHWCWVNGCCKIRLSVNDRDVLTHFRNHIVSRCLQSSSAGHNYSFSL